MKLFSIFMLSLLMTSSNIKLVELRGLYADAPKSKAKAKELVNASTSASDNPTLLGYHGAGKMIMAKYYTNPYSKLKSFNEGKEILEEAIQSDLKNAELRFIRLSIQNNSPEFLGYNKNKNEDKLFLLHGLSSITDEQLKELIINYLNTI